MRPKSRMLLRSWPGRFSSQLVSMVDDQRSVFAPKPWGWAAAVWLVNATVVFAWGLLGSAATAIRVASISAATIAFLPGVVTGIVLLFFLGLGLVLTILSMDEVPVLGDLVEWIVVAGRRFFGLYYCRLGRQPVFWSIPIGLASGGFALWLLAQ